MVAVRINPFASQTRLRASRFKYNRVRRVGLGVEVTVEVGVIGIFILILRNLWEIWVNRNIYRVCSWLPIGH